MIVQWRYPLVQCVISRCSASHLHVLVSFVFAHNLSNNSSRDFGFRCLHFIQFKTVEEDRSSKRSELPKTLQRQKLIRMSESESIGDFKVTVVYDNLKKSFYMETYSKISYRSIVWLLIKFFALALSLGYPISFGELKHRIFNRERGLEKSMKSGLKVYWIGKSAQ